MVSLVCTLSLRLLVIVPVGRFLGTRHVEAAPARLGKSGVQMGLAN